MSEASGTTSGRKESECGAMGVSSVLGTLGATIGPPALSEYAVEPDGVAMIRPSACAGTPSRLIDPPHGSASARSSRTASQ